MHRTTIIGLGLGLVALIAQPALAQQNATGPGTVEVTLAPAGGTFFTSKGPSPSFGNYTYGGVVTYNINRVVGVEGEVGGTAGITQDLDFNGATVNQKTPNTATYSGNVVVSVPTSGSIVPYVTGGIGGLTMFERQELGVNERQSFLTGNVGGGLKWYASSGRWGLRGDYRFLTVKSKDDAPAFFGQDTRYGHRVYAGVILNVAR